MKKTLKALLALTLALACVLTLVACAKPKLNLEKAKDNLEDNDYYVSYETARKNLEPGMEEMLSAYGEDGDYVVIVKFSTKKLAKLQYKIIKTEINNDIEETKLEIKALEYTLKKFGDDLSADEEDDIKDDIKDLKDELEELEESLKYIGRSGKYVWYASSKDAIKATK